jgi:superfamily I DNA and RNA helicase
MIAVVSFRGREHSALTPYTKLAPHTLRAPTGAYDLLGNPLHSAGEVVIDSVYRFKGRSAPCVILTEIDFDELDELVLRKLFVGATRATMKLALVLSERAGAALLARLEDNGG